MNIFDLIEGFNRNERWGDPDKMNPFAIMLAEKVRAAFRMKYDPAASFVIHCGYESAGHVSGSEHTRGNAFDGHIVTVLPFTKQVKALIEIFVDLGISKYIGFGIYPDWNTPGWHLDTRMKMARWGRLDKYRGERIPGIGIDVPEDGYIGIESAVKYAESLEVQHG